MLSELNRQQQLILLGLVILVITGLGVMACRRLMVQSEEIVIEQPLPAAADAKPANFEKIIVHLSGAVRRPGVYSLNKGDRLVDLLALCGGVSQQADLDKINLAEKLADGQKVHIPEAIAPSVAAKQLTAGSSPDKIALNSADLSQLCRIKGIGKATAQRIIDHREKNGPFKSLDDLTRVKGIGKGTLSKLKDQLTI